MRDRMEVLQPAGRVHHWQKGLGFCFPVYCIKADQTVTVIFQKADQTVTVILFMACFLSTGA